MNIDPIYCQSLITVLSFVNDEHQPWLNEQWLDEQWLDEK